MKPWSLSVVSLICLSTVCIKMRKLNAASITDTATGPYTDTDTDTDTCQLGCGYKCLWPGPNALMCVHFNLYKRTRKKGAGIIKGKTGRIRTNLFLLLLSPENVAVVLVAAVIIVWGLVLLLLRFLQFSCLAKAKAYTYTNTRTPTNTHTHTPAGKREVLCMACKSRTAFLYFPIIFMGSPLPGHLSGHYAASRTLIKQITVVLPGFWRWLRPSSGRGRCPGAPMPGSWWSWWSERVCGFLLPISASLPIVASPHLASSHPIRSTIHHWHWFPIPCPAASLLRCPTGLPSLFPGFVVAASGMHIVHLNWSRNGVGRVSFKVILLLCEGTHLRWNSVDDSDKLSPMFRTFKPDHAHMDYWIW